MKKITFEGILSGDHECFCWDVTRETYKQVTGSFPNKYDKSVFNKSGKKKLYGLYPGAILDVLGAKPNAKCKVTISVEAVEEGGTMPIASYDDLIRQLKNAEIVQRVAKRLGSTEAALVWLDVVDVSSGKTPRQMVMNGQIDILEAMLDDQESDFDFPSYA
jgi:hypothetical protein